MRKSTADNPSLLIHLANTLDRYIIPGLGDFGDRYYTL